MKASEVIKCVGFIPIMAIFVFGVVMPIWTIGMIVEYCLIRVIETEKLKAFEKIDLSTGSHKSFESGACIMEMVSYLANEPWSDHPECACRALTAYAIKLNDSGDDEIRARLKSLAPRLIGTRDAFAKQRVNFLVLQSITSLLPILTDALDLKEISIRLREFKVGEWLVARDYINSVRPHIREAAKKHAYAAADAYAVAYAYAAAAAAAASAAYAYADAASAAYAYAAADAYAYAAADAAAAADAEAYAAADAAAAADAEAYAYAAAENKAFWIDIKKDTFEAMFRALEQAIDIKANQ